jgi:hypothetical protein
MAQLWFVEAVTLVQFVKPPLTSVGLVRPVVVPSPS